MRQARHVRTGIDIRKSQLDKLDAKIAVLQQQRAAILDRITELYAELAQLPPEAP